MLSFHPSDHPIAIVQGGPQAGRIVYAHLEEDPRRRIPQRLSTLFRADEFVGGRHQPDPEDIDDIYRALDGHGRVSPHLETQFRRIEAEAIRRGLKHFKLEGEGKLHTCPQAVPNQREMVLLMAPSGCGKSTWIGKYIDNYRAAFPDNEVHLFTSKKDPDPAFKDLFPFDLEGFTEGDPLTPEDFRNSLVVFDDIESITPKATRDAVFALKKALSETGRSSNIYLCVSAHRAMRGQETKDDLNEMDGLVVFPRRGTSYHNKRLLEVYGGLSRPQVKRVMEDTDNTRFAYVKVKGDIPAYCVTEKEVFLL
jgi:hypothetical protein